ncbi:transcriptional regulator [Paraburkholderia sp. MMS20-SJTN17]|uniref:Transcriptional regulator n=1 Tax=Paraburkholderia translucens TaxID=2886945 RepID=A0ABS8KIA7_9BURK|nr:transcriptional regulator [Paraburkholderia sp. MMS20-SJTN17]MCC8404491.1 transcriptional regulator [Paraburkholderia sp. MMS20-SJTN17]
MTSTRRPSGAPPSEPDIQAYADGTLTPERAASLRDYLGKHPAEARRVAFYDRLNAQMQAAFQTTEEPAREHIGRSRRRGMLPQPPGRACRTLLALAVLALTLLALSGWLAAIQVSAQALDNAAVMALAEVTARPFPLASPRPVDPAAPDLDAIGLRLVGQRLLQLGPLQRANEFVYLSGDLKPVVVLSAAAPFAREEPQWAARRIGDMRLLRWTARRQRFVVAGNARTRGLMRAADVMSAR